MTAESCSIELFQAAYNNSAEKCKTLFGVNKKANTEAVIIAADNNNYEALRAMLEIASAKGSIFNENARFGIDMNDINTRLKDKIGQDENIANAFEIYESIADRVCVSAFEEMAAECVSIPLPDYKKGRAYALTHQ